MIAGGNNDVDVEVYGPGQVEIYKGQRLKYETVEFKSKETGEYYFCFSNEFSSFSHKKIYFDFYAGNEQPLTEGIGERHVVLTQLETSIVKIHEGLKLVRDYQTHHRLRESQGKVAATNLNARVQYWSMGESLLFVFISLLQVFILRRFFAVKRSNI